MDWHAWHDAYDLDGSALGRRLHVVQERIVAALDASPPGAVRVVSVCAGQGRDLVGVLSDHPRRGDVVARLVELDPDNAEAARRAAGALGPAHVEVVVGDAAATEYYEGMAPADLVLMCGVFGNISDADIERTVGFCTQLCATDGTLVWTRHRKQPDVFPKVCDWLERLGFVREWVSEPDAGFGVGVHRFAGEPVPLDVGARMFTFVGYDVL
ncbi:SAM-dependent methyltransferase [Streptomyces fulvoviolaceus]|uniref:SAM-dependent methyltransferase n=1 Tax=Streptomyces fulvoviolaceus TaxID=285535 RepID=UPI0021C154C0|nr:SAM-dependent methyltransferase [Streptomyces fulvoviolaceus]MCT9082095.1 SAM-dependent methyltransferase [Streptomyces fulvoviolaceus]